MTTTKGILQLGPGVLKATPWHKWHAWIGPGICDRHGPGEGVYWRYARPVPHWMLTLCEACADTFWMPGRDDELWRLDHKGHPDDGPGESF